MPRRTSIHAGYAFFASNLLGVLSVLGGQNVQEKPVFTLTWWNKNEPSISEKYPKDTEHTK